MKKEKVEEVLSKYRDQILRLKGVTGVGRGNQHIIVFVEKKTPEVEAFIPRLLEGVPVKVVETGKVRLLSFTGRYRPVPGGVSVGHYKVTAGTLGCWVEKNGELFGLSNNHVLALRWGEKQIGEVGDPILQPAPYDGGTLEDKIGELVEWVSVELKKENEVDAALFKPFKGVVEEKILEIGTYAEPAMVSPNQSVKKVGRTSELTHGKIISDSAQIQIEGFGKAVFVNQIVATSFSLPGDSGSLVLDENNRVVGLVFAGSEKVTVINPVDALIREFGLKFVAVPKVPYEVLAVLGLPLLIVGGVKIAG